MLGNIQFKRGIKINLPSSAPSGTPLWCEDSKELYIGTNSGVIKVSASQETKPTNELVTSISASSTDTQYPSAKCVYDLIGNLEQLLSEV